MSPYIETAIERELDAVRSARCPVGDEAGERNSVLFQAGCNLYGLAKGNASDELGYQHVSTVLLDAAMSAGLDAREARATLESAYRKTEPRDVPESSKARTAPLRVVGNNSAPPGPGKHRATFARTDLGNSERLIRDHGGDLRYVYRWRSWLCWADSHWKRDDGDAVAALAVQTVRQMGKDAFDVAEDIDRQAAVKWAMSSQSLSKLKAMSEDPWLLGCPNGTVELKTGTMRPSRRDDCISRVTGCAFNPEARAPGWGSFLRRIFEDDDLIAYVQRAIGYTLTGTTGEQEFFLATGSGANGKSTLLGIVGRVLGDHSITAGFDLFTQDRGGKSKGPGLATLDGPRMVMAMEPNPGAPLDESLIKAITGSDVCCAERKYEAPYDFTPRCKLWLGCNAPPAWRHGGPALARRVRVVPFGVVIPKAEQDTTLADRLVVDEGPGILAWAVRGCLQWQQRGLAPPSAVIEAGAAYESDADPIAEWVDARLEPLVGYSLSLADAHADYSERASKQGLRPVSSRTLGSLLDGRGWRRKKGKTGQLIVDCILKPKFGSD